MKQLKDVKNLMFSKDGKFIRPNEITFGNNVYINNSFHISDRNLTLLFTDYNI